MSAFKLILGVVSNVAVFGVSLFLPAGTLDWWRAWVFLGVVFVGAVASTAALYRVDVALLQERFKPPVQKGQPLADKILVLLLVATFIGLIVFIPLDLFRLHLMTRPGTAVSSAGLVLFAVGWWIVTLAMLENPFAVSVVRLQEERGQRVIDSGVYRVVRHPMYAGALLLMVGMALWLESYAAAVLAIIPVGTLVLRIRIEEEFLRQKLKGYDEYTKRVRYRLIPFLW
ncbi:MAG: isoprenylcysteine carboxylmethyltransferase family protein [Desulfuromonadales bacterium]|nr:MAG: isoprenylcysteine carboxylmethyltransferase family protein [Desulfuromonadales bacterium]